MSEDRLLSALKASKPVKKSEKNFDEIKSTRNKDYDADKVLKTTTKIKPLAKQENHDEEKILKPTKKIKPLEK